MAELRILGGDPSQARTHVIFVHGLGGGIDATWQVEGPNGVEAWPCWLTHDLADVAVWGIGYNAAPSGWIGHSLPLEDRAQNVWSLLRAEERLAHGEIAFIAHSMGGLIAIQLLRCVERDRAASDAEAFYCRVRKIVFLGTPHKGSKIANLLSIVSFILPMRPTVAIRDLRSGSPQLRELSAWFRKLVHREEIAALQLAEGVQLRGWGNIAAPTIVTVESADAGLVDVPTIVDETHLSICKPKNRQAHVYKEILAFLKRPSGGRSEPTRVISAIEAVGTSLHTARSESASEYRALQAKMSDLAKEVRPRPLENTAPMDEALELRIERLRQRRFFPEANIVEEARILAHDVENGDLTLADTAVRREAIAWCLRILVPTETEEAKALLERHPNIDSESAAIIRFRIRALDGELDEAMADMAGRATPASRGAVYIALQHQRGFHAASEWMDAAGVQFEDLDDGAMVQRMSGAQEAGEDSVAQGLALQVESGFLERCAAASWVVANICVSAAIPEASWSAVKQSVLVRLDSVPLKDDPESLALRRRASNCYARLAELARELELKETTINAADWHLWLDLNDPLTRAQARDTLVESLKDPSTLLRRFVWARQCGFEIDLAEIDREINRQVALTGGTRFEHAVARFAIALSHEDPAPAATYLRQHREHLLRHLDPKLVLPTEAGLLAEAGETASARESLEEAERAGVQPSVIERLQAKIDETGMSDAISVLRSNYEKSRNMFDLRALMEAYVKCADHENAIKCGEELVKRGGSRADARYLALVQYEGNDPEGALSTLKEYPVLNLDAHMRLLQAQCLYDIGKLPQAAMVLEALRREDDSSRARILHLQLKITSGDWVALQAFVEDQWSMRITRAPIELLQAGQIAQHIGAPRSKDLIREAARRADDDATILTACYHATTSAGWENDTEAAEWLHRAVELSEDKPDSPIHPVSLDFLLERQPEWEAREAHIINLAMSGEIPLFTVAQSLKRPLVRLILLEALTNRTEPAVRRRSIVLTTSGARHSTPARPQSIALDPVALLTAALLDILDEYCKAFETIWVAHETLAWLFVERTQLRFHQPSQVEAALALQHMVSDGTVRLHQPILAPSEALVREVGEALAKLLADAATHHDDGVQRLVVTSGTVWKVGSAMRAEADLSRYHQVMCSARDVLDVLIRRRLLTAKQIENARRWPELRPLPVAPYPDFGEEPLLLLDDTAASVLRAADLLKLMGRAGFNVMVTPSLVEEARLLISHNVYANEALEIVERLRSWLEAGIEAGWVRLLVAERTKELAAEERWFGHPSATFLRLTGRYDACVVDDRFINRHNMITSGPERRPVISSWDVLNILREEEVIDSQTWHEARTTLRQYGYALAPIDADELFAFLTSAQVVEGMVAETIDLRAVREAVVRIRMSDVLQIPAEASWLDNIRICCLRVLQRLWVQCPVGDQTWARSDWLLALCDPRGWAHRMPPDYKIMDKLYQAWIEQLLMLLAGKPVNVKEAYGQWLENRLLLRLKEEEPDLFDKVIAAATVRIEALVQHCLVGSSEQ